MSVVLLEDARARGIALPSDDAVAQDIIDEQEAWLARRIGLLEGARTETFFVGGLTVGGDASVARLGLRRYTDSVTVTDAGAAVDAARYRLVGDGSAIVPAPDDPAAYWTGPFVTVTYTPNDLSEVKAAIYNLLALAGPTGTPENGLASETIGAYSYSRGAGGAAPTLASKAVIASSLLPKQNQAATLYASTRRSTPGDPVINLPEPAWP